MHVVEKTKDELTGVITTIGFEDDKMVIRQEQDVQPLLEHTQQLRNDAQYSANGIKQNMWHCVHIPDGVGFHILEHHGFNIWTEPAEEVFKFLSRHSDKYGKVKTTEGKF